MNPDADVRLFGQKLIESYAICLADMLIKGENSNNIRLQDTMKRIVLKINPCELLFPILLGASWGGKDAADGVEAVKDEA